MRTIHFVNCEGGKRNARIHKVVVSKKIFKVYSDLRYT